MACASNAATPDEPPSRLACTLPAAAERKTHPGDAALAVASRRRILVEAHQMRADALTVGGHRGGRERRRSSPTRPAPGARRAAARWCAAPVARPTASSRPGERPSASPASASARGPIFAGSGFSGVGCLLLLRRRDDLRLLLRRGRRDLFLHGLRSRGLGRRGVRLLHHGSRRHVHRRRLRRRR